jgi:hypothetical protein
MSIPRSKLNRLYSELRIFRSKRRKYKYKFMRKGDLLSIAMLLPIGKMRINDYMEANDMIRWFEGFYYAIITEEE